MKRNIIMQIGLAIVLATALIIGAGCGSSSGGGSSGSSVIPEATGILDNTFGISGVVTTTINITNKIKEIALQPDGKIVAGGYTSDGATTHFTLARYTSTGTLDSTFGDGDGVVTTTIATNSVAYNIALQADGKIIAGGYASDTFNNWFALARYTITGTLDTTFGTGGVVTTVIGAYSYINDIAIQANGKIVAGGRVDDSGTYCALACYDTNGALDTTFGGGDGVVTHTIGTSSIFYALTLQTDGKIVAAGESQNSDTYFALARYTPAGALDTTFDTDGVVTTAIGTLIGDIEDSCYSVAIQPDGKIVAGGYSYDNNTDNYYNAVVRYTVTGALDATFAGDGVFTNTVPTYVDIETYAIAFQSNGKILLGCYAYNDSNNDFMIIRLNANGALDTTFDTDGVITATLGTDSEIDDLKIQPDGKIVVGGFATYGGYQQFALMRFK
jgi:uncharacterized delta-60 repeat protein